MIHKLQPCFRETEINIHKSRAEQLFAAASFFTNFSWVLDFLSAFRTGPIISRHDICQKVLCNRSFESKNFTQKVRK